MAQPSAVDPPALQQQQQPNNNQQSPPQTLSPSSKQLQSDQQSQHHKSKDKKRRKDRRKDKKKKKKYQKIGKSGGGISRKRRDHQSYGNQPGHMFGRRESIPHHATVHSLASINAPIVVSQLTKMSTDFKYQRELQKALMELKQKDEDYRYAVEIGESLTKENTFLKEQIEMMESSLHSQEGDNIILKEKLQTLSEQYNIDISKYHQDLAEHKELVQHLTISLQQKQDELDQSRSNNKPGMNNSNMNNNNNNRVNMMKFSRMTSDDVNNLTSDDFNSSLERKLFTQLNQQKEKYEKQAVTVENLMKKLDESMKYKKKYNEYKKKYRDLEQITKDQLAEHIQMQKSVEQEAIYLAARKANLEEEREDLLNLIDQKDYEISLLNAQLKLQSKHFNTRTNHSQTITTKEPTLLDDMATGNVGGSSNNSDLHSMTQSYDNDDGSASSEMDIIAELLEDEDFLNDGDDFSDDDDDDMNDMNAVGNTTIVDNQSTNNNNTYNIDNDKKLADLEKKRKEEEKTKDQKAFDKIKEYLHLTASAVKIKYPTVRNIQSDELIKRVKELPFYKYHDQMVRIMDNQVKKMRDLEKKKHLQNTKNTATNSSKSDVSNTNSSSGNTNAYGLGRRKSFLSIFNIFGGVSAGDDIDSDDSDDDNKTTSNSNSNTTSNNTYDVDGGLSQRRKRASSSKPDNFKKPKKRKKRKSKKYRKKKNKKNSGINIMSDASDDDLSDNDDKTRKNSAPNFTGTQTRYRKGVSVMASSKRLKNI